MLGNAVFQQLSERADWDVFGTMRDAHLKSFFADALQPRIHTDVDVGNWSAIETLLGSLQPDVIVNCVGVVKQLAAADDPLVSIPINALLPHRLAAWCREHSGRLVHISTDCVFSGRKGRYGETDPADAYDLYGRSKLLGEVDGSRCITLRTSIIGHELTGNRSLLNWFLSQENTVKGYGAAIFSGLPTVELARIIRDRVVSDETLEGLFHVASDPINKYDLLCLIASVYGKRIDIVRDDTLAIDRSLSADKFTRRTGYVAPPWPALVAAMYAFQ